MKPKFTSQREAFIRSFFAGMAAQVFLFSPEFPKRHIDPIRPANRMSDKENMRADWCRIGEDFGRVIDREAAGCEQGC